MFGRIDKDETMLFCHLPVFLRQRLRPFYGAFRKGKAEGGGLDSRSDLRRADEHNFWYEALLFFCKLLHDLNQGFRAFGDFLRGRVEDLFQVIASQHHEDHVDGLVCIQTGAQIVHTVFPALQRVVEDGGSAVAALLNHFVVIAEKPRHAAGPADAFRIAQSRERIVSVGIGISVAEDGFRHDMRLLVSHGYGSIFAAGRCCGRYAQSIDTAAGVHSQLFLS